MFRVVKRTLKEKENRRSYIRDICYVLIANQQRTSDYNTTIIYTLTFF